MKRSRLWLMAPLAGLFAVAATVAALAAIVPVLWSWYCAQLPPGLPYGAIALFAIAAIVAAATTRGPSS